MHCQAGVRPEALLIASEDSGLFNRVELLAIEAL